MAHVSLRESDDWQLVHDDQDVIGWEVKDRSGEIVGHVEDMVIDTDDETVDTIVLEDGTRVPAADIQIGDGVIYTEDLVLESGVVTRPYYGGVVRNEDVVEGVDYDYGAYEEDFQTHCDKADYTYEEYEPAYRFGYEYARNNRYHDREYEEIEPELRTRYAERYPDYDYDESRDAIRYAYDRARTRRT